MENESVIFYPEPFFIPRLLILLAVFLLFTGLFFLLMNNDITKIMTTLVQSSVTATALTFFIYLFLKTKISKIAFYKQHFHYKKQNFQYVDIDGFDFKDNKITIHMKHFREPLKFTFLEENDANLVAEILKQKSI